MIYFAAYIFLGISTGVYAYMTIDDDWRKRRAIGWAAVWPLIWFMLIFVYVTGRNPAKCIWCGETVGPMNVNNKNIGLWRAHYLDKCPRHPLALRLKEYGALIDDLDARNTANRVRAEKAEAQLKPFLEIGEMMQKKIVVKIDKHILDGDKPC